MDLKGSLVNTKLKIIPSKKLLDFIQTISAEAIVPENVFKVLKNKGLVKVLKNDDEINSKNTIHLSDDDIAILKDLSTKINSNNLAEQKDDSDIRHPAKQNKDEIEQDSTYLETSDLVWIYKYLKEKRNHGNDIPYLHELLEGSDIILPENRIIKRNPDLEARCVKLRAQQEAREYRKMTKAVDNVRMRYPEDSIAYQLKHLNRQLIAIGQFIISIFAGFLFGFRGIEWIVGNLDFGFRLLLGVICALVIALAEIYFLAKKLNEEYSMPETIQLGGPPKFADSPKHEELRTNGQIKEHKD